MEAPAAKTHRRRGLFALEVNDKSERIPNQYDCWMVRI